MKAHSQASLSLSRSALDWSMGRHGCLQHFFFPLVWGKQPATITKTPWATHLCPTLHAQLAANRAWNPKPSLTLGQVTFSSLKPDLNWKESTKCKSCNLLSFTSSAFFIWCLLEHEYLKWEMTCNQKKVIKIHMRHLSCQRASWASCSTQLRGHQGRDFSLFSQEYHPSCPLPGTVLQIRLQTWWVACSYFWIMEKEEANK